MANDQQHDRASTGEHPLADLQFLTVNEAAELLSLGRTKIYELLDTGALRSIRIGTARRVPVWAVREFVGAHLSEKTIPVTPVVHTALGGGK